MRMSRSIVSATRGVPDITLPVGAAIAVEFGSAALGIVAADAAEAAGWAASRVPASVTGFGFTTSAWYAYKTRNERKMARRTRLSITSNQTESAAAPTWDRSIASIPAARDRSRRHKAGGSVQGDGGRASPGGPRRA